MRTVLGDARGRAALPWLAMALVAAGTTPAGVPIAGEWWRALPLGALLVAGLLVGLGTLALAVARERTLARGAALLAALTLLAVPLVAAVSTFAILFGPVVLLVPFGVLGLSVVALLVRGRREGRPAIRSALGAAVVGLAAVAIGLADGLVWLPHALAPGYEIGAIHDELVRRDEAYGIAMLAVWAAVSALAVLLTALAALRRRETARRAAAMTVAPAIAALLLLPWWEFSMGMSLSDALPPGNGGGMSAAMPWIGALAAMLAGCATWLALPPTASAAGRAVDAPTEPVAV